MDPYEGRYRYCPGCRSEYRPGFQICTDCGLDLVDELPAEPPPEVVTDRDQEALESWVGTDPVAVLETYNGVQALIARGVLIDSAIPCSVWESGSHVGIHAVRVMVHKDDEAEARALLAAQFAD